MRFALRGGTVYDGTGAPGIAADVLLEDGRVATVGSFDAEAEEVDATGLAVARTHERFLRDGPYSTIEAR